LRRRITVPPPLPLPPVHLVHCLPIASHRRPLRRAHQVCAHSLPPLACAVCLRSLFGRARTIVGAEVCCVRACACAADLRALDTAGKHDGSWMCGVCTFLNEGGPAAAAARACAACGTDINDAIAPLDVYEATSGGDISGEGHGGSGGGELIAASVRGVAADSLFRALRPPPPPPVAPEAIACAPGVRVFAAPPLACAGCVRAQVLARARALEWGLKSVARACVCLCRRPQSA
jgi:hypothetical protein